MVHNFVSLCSIRPDTRNNFPVCNNWNYKFIIVRGRVSAPIPQATPEANLFESSEYKINK